ncbi:hypothetical protein IJM86_04390 [bacterium]|nr:hypothetical protein [bacterium]
MIRIVSEMQKKVYAVEKGYKVKVKVGEVLEKGKEFAVGTDKNKKLKVMERGEVLEIRSDSIVF